MFDCFYFSMILYLSIFLVTTLQTLIKTLWNFIFVIQDESVLVDESYIKEEEKHDPLSLTGKGVLLLFGFIKVFNIVYQTAQLSLIQNMSPRP